jgi:hypothetical protein
MGGYMGIDVLRGKEGVKRKERKKEGGGGEI